MDHRCISSANWQCWWSTPKTWLLVSERDHWPYHPCCSFQLTHFIPLPRFFCQLAYLPMAESQEIILGKPSKIVNQYEVTATPQSKQITTSLVSHILILTLSSTNVKLVWQFLRDESSCNATWESQTGRFKFRKRLKVLIK